MDLLLMERQLRDTLANVIAEVSPDDGENKSSLSEVLADGLTRYLVYARRPMGREEEDFELLIDSLKFWARMHSFSSRKPVQKQNGPAILNFAAKAGR